MNIFEEKLSQLEEIISRRYSFYKFLKKCKVKYQKIKYCLLKNSGRSEDFIYNRSFFDKNLEWNLPIASEMVDIFVECFHPCSVVDVGCGNAEFLCQFQKKGIEIQGYDGSSHALDKAQVDKKFIELFDLRDKITSPHRYDLALCLEVAEHIERKFSETLIDSLTNLSDKVIFTAATPGQGGHFHINEQKNDFWIDIFNKKGFVYDYKITKELKVKMEQRKILWWYQKNLMVFRKR